jgi:1-acyl-sn-glycerol-3-phosphate acyltransferase
MTAVTYRVSLALARAMLRVCFRARWSGAEHVPRHGAVLLASNHASFLDPLIVGSFCGRICRFLARASLGKVPLVGRWMRAVGTVFVAPGAPTARAMDVVIDLLLAGEAVVVFPEGTRSRDGRVAPFKRGILLLVKKTGAAVVPVGIHGSFQALPKGRRLPRLFRRCTVAYGEPMTAAELLATGGLEALQQRVAALAGQTRPGLQPVSAAPVAGRTSSDRRAGNSFS